MSKLGRILVRADGLAGVFIPYGEGLKPGLYDIVDILEVMTIERVGKPAMIEKRLQSLSPDELLDEREKVFLTKKEYRDAAR